MASPVEAAEGRAADSHPQAFPVSGVDVGPEIAMVAGEASGDLLASLLLKGARQKWPGMHAVGIGGPRMIEQGFETWWPQSKLAVRGYVEVLRHLREILQIRKALAQRLTVERPNVFVGVDAPDFNLGLEAMLRAQGIKTVHFVGPSIWAWRPERIEKVRVSADHVLCIFPFEPPIYEKAGIAATYVGHPLAGVIPLAPDRAAAKARLGIPVDDVPLLAILPGSVASEIGHNGPVFLAAAAELQRRGRQLRLVLPTLPALRPVVERQIQAAGLAGHVILLEGRSHDVLEACDLTLIASGTATLEAVLYKRPMVIGYRVNWLTAQIMKRKALQPWVGLPNILCRDFVVPELLQHNCTPRALADALQRWLDSPEAVQNLTQRFLALHHELRRDTATLATHAIEKVLSSA
ncbi:MAG: Lipid-A-disaccharide synthase [Paracidovorax wautersii]|uniref:Lipid-A-disaccharide synthase n=1 Tax=Paracidovorax wautersii TaxID=1177982 RepID=A0A7V8FS71_9BURK|nr:MAG: Lipid-A-disaccharide synthase [Paracidovorax wautersii]